MPNDLPDLRPKASTLFLCSLFLGMASGAGVAAYFVWGRQTPGYPTTWSAAAATTPAVVLLVGLLISLDRSLVRAGQYVDTTSGHAEVEAYGRLRAVVPDYALGASLGYGFILILVDLGVVALLGALVAMGALAVYLHWATRAVRQSASLRVRGAVDGGAEAVEEGESSAA